MTTGRLIVIDTATLIDRQKAKIQFSTSIVCGLCTTWNCMNSIVMRLFYLALEVSRST